MNTVIVFLGLFLFLTGCDSVKSTLGMDHYQADEFNLKQNESLSIPPNYKLMPPRTKDKDGNSVALNPSAEKAKQVVGGGESKTSLSQESLDDLKGKVGSEDDAIRKRVDEEAKQEGETDLDKKLNAWKKEFSKNANSINEPQESAKAPNQEKPVEKLKDQLAKDKSTGDHEDSLQTKVEADIHEHATLKNSDAVDQEIQRVGEMRR